MHTHLRTMLGEGMIRQCAEETTAARRYCRACNDLVVGVLLTNSQRNALSQPDEYVLELIRR